MKKLIIFLVVGFIMFIFGTKIKKLTKKRNQVENGFV